MKIRGLLIFSAVEVATLVWWRLHVGSLIGGTILVGGLFLEHLLATNVKLERSLVAIRDLPFGKLFVNAVGESLLWVLWLALWPVYTTHILGGLPLVATAFLAGGLVVEHSFTDSVFRGEALPGNLLKPKVIGFSLIETAAATAWMAALGAGLGFLAIVPLAVGSFLEHRMAIAIAQR